MPAPRASRAVKRKASSADTATAAKAKVAKRSRVDLSTKPTLNGLKKKAQKVSLVSHRSHGHVVGQTLTIGTGDTGQLGLGEDIMDRARPALVKIDGEIVQIAAGGMHTACLTKDGKVFTFGCNDEGALGRSTPEEEDCFEPSVVDLKAKIVQISAGDSHTAALADDGELYGWGTFRDANGSIGLQTPKTRSPTPIVLLSGQRVIKVASGDDHILCLTENGQIFSMGNADQGQLGRVAECFSTRGGRKGLSLLLTPAAVHCKLRKAKFTDVWTGGWTSFAKTDTGDIYSWGLNNYFQIGFDDMVNRYVPDRCKSFKTDLDWKDISGGQHHTIALDANGQVYTLGRKDYGVLGLGDNVTEEKSEPTAVTSLKDVKCSAVTCGSAVSLAVAENGAVYAWGMGCNQQLGQAEDDDLYEPTQIISKQMETRDGIMVSAGGQHTVILAKDKS
ncbi:hypothetical protein CAPTEDRAFT_159495 [Capitella teleta]|uniref:RCC1-like domain-containing protein n=1 Tax=Capitella teleta TaxID=283909 RepID=R7TG70_CAPTE|nr:hypothetical protein CAPTEDRAFT_159495 [Capitella teleta]|eukprot:ELT90046.1 hypothetical protein CAPTEDRAFT_159495 [Capitella teleta]